MGLRCCSSYPAWKLFHVELAIVKTVQRENLTEADTDFAGSKANVGGGSSPN